MMAASDMAEHLDEDAHGVALGTRAEVLARAREGALLGPADLRILFDLSKTSYHRHAVGGDFDVFLVKGPVLGLRKYAGMLVYRYLQGEDPTRTFAAPRGSRK
jgi:hypothetical protein